MYALVDCNNFYVSCERVFQPQLNNKPVVVLSNNDGCVISRSNEAKQLGISMGAPEFQLREKIKANGIHVFSSNYALYGDLSDRVMRLLTHFTPNVEVYSIDEAFLNFEGMKIPNYESYGAKMKTLIHKCVGIPICVGFAPSKALAKVANKIAKKFPDRTQGVYVIDTEEKRLKALKWTKIEDVWGIGFRLTKKMLAKNIKTAYDFTLPQHEAFIKREMGVVGIRLRMELLGVSVLEMEEPKSKKNIAVTRSFENDIADFESLKERILTFASVCSEKLRKQNSCCTTVILYLKKNKFKVNQGDKYNFYRMESLPFATNTSFSIGQAATKMLNDIYQEGTAYKKAGIIVTTIIPQGQKQFSLFDEENPKYQRIVEVMDFWQKKSGERKIKLAGQDLSKTWKMRQNHLSQCYTTDINEILKVKC
jgi:DNA polymerase V